MKTFAFKSRLFLTYTAVIAAVVVLFTAALYFITANLNRRTELYHQQEIYRNSLAEVEAILRQMDRLAEQVISNNEILGCFIPLATDSDPSNYFDQNLIDRIRISSLLSSLNGTDNYAARISVFNGQGDYVSTGTLYETPSVVEAVLSGDTYATLSADLLRRGDAALVSGFHHDTWSNHPRLRLLSLRRALASYTGAVYGVVDIQVTADAFAQLGIWQNGISEYALVDAAGNAVYPFVETGDAQAALQALAALLAESDGHTAVLERRIGGQDMILMGTPVAPSDWLFVRLLPASALLAPYANVSVIIAVASLVLLCCLVLVMYYLSSRIAGPLQRMSAAFSGVNLQNIRQAIDDTSLSYSTAELAALSRAFHGMLIRLDRSVAMEIQAHMRALQSQMNPHFLFNMLSVIIESSEEAGDGRTVAMCLKLSAMLRYVADFNGDHATLTDELRHARNYLDLMKDRYEDSFTYEIIADGPLEAVTLPKMVIQPLTENCFAHGFRDVRPPWHVRVAATVAGGRWTLEVIDNGGGITEEAVAAIHEKVEIYRSDVATNYKNLRLGGMGLVNTLLRLSLAQGDRVDFAIAPHEGGGTRIVIGGVCDDSRPDRGG